MAKKRKKDNIKLRVIHKKIGNLKRDKWPNQV